MLKGITYSINTIFWSTILFCIVLLLGVLLGKSINREPPPFEVERDYVTFEIQYGTILVDDKGKYVIRVDEFKEDKVE